jgi:CheY-like chemotaxis protein
MSTHIMVIDDEPLICRLLEYQLGGSGYEVVSYQRAYDAMVELARHPPDLILLDVMMPEISGLDLCTQIRSSYSIPIIMLTAKDGDDDVIRGLTSGADDYLGKPFNQGQLVARIEAVLRRARPSNSGRSRPVGHMTTTAVPSPEATPTVRQPAAAPVVVPSAVLPAATPPNLRPVVARVRAAAPAQPTRLGVHLAAARRQRGLSLHDAGLACGVRWEFLQAIEQEEFGYVPQANLRHALRAYSSLLGVDLSVYRRRRRSPRRPRPLIMMTALVIMLALVFILAAMLL